jgi:hypothetical protein
MKLFIVILATAALTAVVQNFCVPHYQYYSHPHPLNPRITVWERIDTWSGKREISTGEGWK